MTKEVCVLCKKPAHHVCSRCQLVHFCSRNCQRLHWKNGHNRECRTQPSSSITPSSPSSPSSSISSDPQQRLSSQILTEHNSNHQQNSSLNQAIDTLSVVSVKSNRNRFKICVYCEKPALHSCSLCHKIYYCSKECQKQNWMNGHREQCTRDRRRGSSSKYTTISSPKTPKTPKRSRLVTSNTPNTPNTPNNIRLAQRPSQPCVVCAQPSEYW